MKAHTGLKPLVGMGIIVALLSLPPLQVPGAPRTEETKPGAARLISGPGDAINEAIAAGATAVITLQPVNPKTVPATTYPPGSSVTNQTLTLTSVPVRIWVEVLITGWAPDAIYEAQVTVSASDLDLDGGGYSGANAQCDGAPASGAGDLTPAMQPCSAVGAAGNAECRAAISGLASACAIGEPSRCQNWSGVFPGGYFPPGLFCQPGFVNSCEPDWIGSGIGNVSATDISIPDFRFGFSALPDEIPVDFSPSYLGTFVIDAPANAKGAYTIDIDENETFLNTQAFPPNNDIPIAQLRSAVIDIPCGPRPDPSGVDKTRFISFSPNAGVAALRVIMVSMHQVVPPYAGGPTIPYTSFEFGPNCAEAGGCVRWVGPPQVYMESTSGGTPFYAALLQCSPHYQDWSTVGLLHVTGSAITPSSTYDVESVDASCTGSEPTCTAVSSVLSLRTTRWGDVRSPYNPPSPTAQPDISDVSELVDKFRSAPGALSKVRGLLAGEPGNPFGEITDAVLDEDFGFGQISACVNAFRGPEYPYTVRSCP